jgi:tetratricopeptide (TPR) repeat protein
VILAGERRAIIHTFTRRRRTICLGASVNISYLVAVALAPVLFIVFPNYRELSVAVGVGAFVAAQYLEDMYRYCENMDKFEEMAGSTEANLRAQGFVGIGKTYAGAKKVKVALASFSRAVEIDPCAWTYGQRADALLAFRAYRSAIDDFTKAFEFDPASGGRPLDGGLVEAYSKRAKCYRALGMLSEAAKDLGRVEEIAHGTLITAEWLEQAETRIKAL